MPIFTYTARDEKNVKVKGKVEARDERHAAQVLRERTMVVITIKADSDGISLGFLDTLTNRVSRDDVVTFTQQLATMLGAGLPLTEGLEMLRYQSKPGLAKVLGDILHDVQGGASLGDALGRHKGVFSDVYVALVKTGEASGKLDTVLIRLAESEEKQRQFRSKTKGAMVYPAIVMAAMTIVVSIMMIFVVPQMTSMYDSFGAELPFMTQILIGISDFMRNTWWLALLIIAGGAVGFKQWYKTPQGRHQIDELALKIPVLGPLRSQIIMTEFSMTLSLLVGAGISILEGLVIVTEAVDNVVYKDALKRVSKGVEKGMPMASMLARQHVFPPLLSQMVSVGEETGELETVLIKVAKYFEQVAEQTIKNLTTAIEPLIMIVLGLVVGFIVLAIITPLYKITEMF
jgi:type IV pilus assembly protein PilC